MQSLIDTRKEYVEYLQDTISIPISERIYEMYIQHNKKGKNVLKEFQNDLENIPQWNNHTIENETKTIVEKSKCKHLYKIVKLVIITSIKVKFQEYDQNIKHIKIKVPSLEDFIHKCFINAATFAWKYSYLFCQSKLTTVQIQNNMNNIENHIKKTITKSIRQFVNIPELIEELESLADNSIRKKNGNKKNREHHVISKHESQKIQRQKYNTNFDQQNDDNDDYEKQDSNDSNFEESQDDDNVDKKNIDDDDDVLPENQDDDNIDGHEIDEDASVDHESGDNASVDHESGDNASVDHESGDNASVDHESEDRDSAEKESGEDASNGDQESEDRDSAEKESGEDASNGDQESDEYASGDQESEENDSSYDESQDDENNIDIKPEIHDKNFKSDDENSSEDDDLSMIKIVKVDEKKRHAFF